LALSSLEHAGSVYSGEEKKYCDEQQLWQEATRTVAGAAV